MNINLPEGSIGAIVTDCDLTRISNADFQALYASWLDRGLLVVRDQTFTIENFLATGERFGRLKPHRVKQTRDPDYPTLTVMGLKTKKESGEVNSAVFERGSAWHTDGPWDQEVIKATQLYGLEIPTIGGDTLFRDMRVAYDALPKDLQERIAGLKARFIYGGRSGRTGLLSAEDKLIPPAVHPVVNIHSETGRKSLYINHTHFLDFEDMPHDESEALADELLKYTDQNNSEHRHHWQKHDYVIWDNRCLLHAAAGGYPIDQKRVHWRSTVVET